MPVQNARASDARSPTAWGVACLLALVLVTAGCGGGSDDLLQDSPTLQMTPQVLEANSNTPCVLHGPYLGTAPVTVRMVDTNGTLVGPVRTVSPDASGLRIDMQTPILPELTQDTMVRVEVRASSGAVFSTDPNVLIRVRESEVRTITGVDNQAPGSTVGAAGVALRRDVAIGYSDGLSAPARPTAPSAREVSNQVAAEVPLPNRVGLVPSDLFWVFGQFLDHDLGLTPPGQPAEPFPIAVPTGDPWFDPFATGSQTIPLDRSVWLAGTGATSPRLQPNVITSWIDGSNVYGSDAVRAQALRTLDGTGRLRTSAGNLLPFNTGGLPNDPSAGDPTLFLAGDIRANEQLGLTCLHIVFMREHNRKADEIRAANPHLGGEEIYQAARRWVGALMQVIAYREWLPTLLGDAPLGEYPGFNPSEDATLGVLFTTCAFRLGHTMVGPRLWRLDATHTPIAEGHLLLRDAFFNPSRIASEGGVEPILRGLSRRAAEPIDAHLVGDLRNFLFGPPGSGGLDLASLNIQRGRDHGLPDYNSCRTAYGLQAAANFSGVATVELEQAFTNLFATPDAADPWPVFLAEPPQAPALVGESLATVLKEQFRRLRDGDRFWYERIFGGETLAELRSTRLSDVIRRNTGIGAELADRALLTDASNH